MKETFYFSHDYNPTDDLKIGAMLTEFGAVGYGLFWRFIELMHSDKDHAIPHKKYVYLTLAKQMSTSVEQIETFVEQCINVYEIFESDGEKFWNNRVNRNIGKRNEIKEKRANAGKISAEKRKLASIGTFDSTNDEQDSTHVEQVLTLVEQNSTNANKEKESKVKEKKEKEIKEKDNIKDSRKSFFVEVKNIFSDEFLNSRGFDYSFTNHGRVNKSISILLEAWKVKNKGKDTSEAIEGFRWLFNEALKIQDKYFHENMDINFIANNINKINTIIKSNLNGTVRKSNPTKSEQTSDEQLWRAISSAFAEAEAKQQQERDFDL